MIRDVRYWDVETRGPYFHVGLSCGHVIFWPKKVTFIGVHKINCDKCANIKHIPDYLSQIFPEWEDNNDCA